MKLKILLFLFIVLSIHASAQDSSQSEVKASIGLKAGLNCSSFSPAEFSDYRISYQLGIVTHWQLAQYDYIVGELLFSNEGDDAVFLKGYYNILMPILYKRDLSNWLSLELGPQGSLNIGYAKSDNIWGAVFAPDNNFSLAFCAGLAAYVDDRNYFNLRVAKGVTPVFKDPDSFNTVFSLCYVKIL